MDLWKKYSPQIYFHLLLNVIVAFCITLSSYYHIPLSGFNDHFIYLIHFLILQFSFFGILYFLNINKYIFYAIFPVLYICLSLLAFYKYSQDIIISKSLIEAIFETSLLVSVDLFSIYFVIYLLIIILFLLLIFRQYKKLEINQVKSPLLFIALFGGFVFYYNWKI